MRTCLDLFVRTENWHVTILVGTNSYLWGQNAHPHEFEGFSIRVTVRSWLELVILFR